MRLKEVIKPILGSVVIAFAVLMLFTTCEKDDNPSGNNKVELSSKVIGVPSYTSINLSASLTSNGNSSLIDHGFCYSTTPAPDKGDSVKSLGPKTGTGAFNISLDGLLSNTKFYIRAFATIASGTIYSQESSFTTLKTGRPQVFTDSVFSITPYTAQFSGTIVSDSGLAVSACGFCWGTAPHPDFLDSTITSLSAESHFIANIGNLTNAITYYVRAYATNVAGTSFGDDISFFTNPITPIVTVKNITNITTTYAMGGGDVTNDGGATIIGRGVCWSTTENPTIFGSHTIDGDGSGSFTSDLNGLAPSTTYFVRAYATNIAGTAYSGQISFVTSSLPTIPVVTTSDITNITTNYGLGGGNVLSDGGSSVITRGVCWSTSQNPTILGLHTTNGSGTGAFTSDLISLSEGTTYYVRAYATNSIGTDYGNQVSFTTGNIHTIPTVTTTVISSITSTGAVSGGNVTSTGGDAVAARGICWSTSPNPTITGSHTTDGNGSGAFISTLSGLNPSTTYYVRAYATNISGTAYGEQLSFATTAQAVLPTLVTATVTSITANSAVCGGNITDDGGATVTARGVCWSTTQNPTIANQHSTDGTGTGSYSSSMTVLNASTIYYVRAYATNSAGTAYGGQQSFTTLTIITTPSVTTTAISGITSTNAIGGGNVTNSGGASVTARGVCWSTSQNPTIFGSHTNDGSGTGSFISNISGLSPTTTYYVRAYATNSEGTAYGSQQSFITTINITIPSVSTAAVTDITSGTATSGGNVTASGGATVTARGVCWSTSQNPTIGGSYTTDGSGTGSFISYITGLNPSTTYYVRAYATNSQGTAYGSQLNFTTPATINCNNFTLTHIAGSVAPVTKTVTYGTVITDLSGETKCWITQNLGADHQATTVDDATEASAGWYWQFNRKQGFKADGSIITPYLEWETSIDETSNWIETVDPCFLLLGNNWRIPTYTEWNNLDVNSNWTNWNGPWNSELKLHAAGYLYMGSSLYNRGSGGFYWSNSQFSNSHGQDRFFSSGLSIMDNDYKVNGFTLRCLSDGNTTGATLPSVTTSDVTSVTYYTAACGGDVTFSGNSSVFARGVCWSVVPNPDLSDSHTIDGSGTGTFTSSISGLNISTLYYVRAYATNSVGTTYGNEEVFTTPDFECGSFFTVTHVAGNIAPVDKTISYGTNSNNFSGDQKCWITQNLGADHQATAASDATEASAGWYWQFNRKQGFKHDGTIRTPSTTWIYPINETSDWISSNDPCTLLLGSGWRIPTYNEWYNADFYGKWNSYIDTYNSVLKIHAAGYLSSSDGNLGERGSNGNYWSSIQETTSYGWRMNIGLSNSTMIGSNKAFGFSIRCLKD